MEEKGLNFHEAIQLILKNLDQNSEPCNQDIWIPSFTKSYCINSFPEITDAFKDSGDDAIKTVRD